MSNEKALESIAKFITDFTKYPMKLYHPIALFSGFMMGDFKFSQYRKLKKKKFKFECSDGSKLWAEILYADKKKKNPDGRKRIVLMSHGFGNSAPYMLRYAGIYLEKGYDIMIFDHRGNGTSSKYPHSMGYFESKDLVEIAKYLRKKYGKSAVVGLHGESMGSASLYMSLPDIQEYTDFMVCDCGYSNMPELAAWIAKALFFLPTKTILEYVEKHSEVNGIHYSDVNSLDKVKNTSPDYPIYFIHGGGDFFVPTHMTKDLYEQKSGKKKITIYGKAFHACSQFMHKEDYRQNIYDFLSENGIEK